MHVGLDCGVSCQLNPDWDEWLLCWPILQTGISAPAVEMKHGPIPLVDAQTPSVFIASRCYVHDKTLSNMQEIKARGGPVIAMVTEGDARTAEIADEIVELLEVDEFLQPIVYNIPLQLFAYHVAVSLDCDVDKPCNLAKALWSSRRKTGRTSLDSRYSSC